MNIESLTSDAVKLLCQLIVIPRFSREETQAADMLEQVMSSEYGFDVNREGNNLWCVHPDYQPNRSTLLLNAHIDTVKPTAAWTRNPHEASIEDGIIYGLGSNDDGASLVSLIQVFRVLSQKTLSYNLILALSAEEEVSGKNGMEHLLTVMPNIDVALVGEPTGMHPAIAEKGLMVLDLTAHGKAGHAARNEGDNALYKAIEDIARLREYRFESVSSVLGDIKLSVTQIAAGRQHNIVPDSCTFVVDVRTIDAYSNEQTVELLQSAVKYSTLTPRSTRVRASAIAESHPLVMAAVAAGRECFISPTTSDRALMSGIAALKIGVGESARSHTADEYIHIHEIEQAIEFYKQLLQE